MSKKERPGESSPQPELDERQARLVELRFFGGLSMEAAAEVLGCSLRTAEREWRFARAWMFTELGGE